MERDDDWDLFALVRSCSSSAAATATGQESTRFGKDCTFSATNWSQELLETREDKGLNDLLKPFLPKPKGPPQMGLFCPISPHSVLGVQDLSPEKQQGAKKELFSVANGSKPTLRSKKRKNHLKKVCHVSAENLSSDIWSWRKYGQKPIKGSPYPRGYYRCSTSKGCTARKQVERHRSDPGMFIITYTGEHSHAVPTHRNSLAGSTRHKPSDLSKKPETQPASEKTESSPEIEDDHDEEEDFGASKMTMDDDFFAGLEDFAGECLSDPITTDSELNWLANDATTTPAGGGDGGGGS